jgi:hypothetical protein
MKDLNEKLRQRWQEKRSKASNWRGLLIKVILFIALLYAVSKFNTSKNIVWSGKAPVADSVQSPAPTGTDK